MLWRIAKLPPFEPKFLRLALGSIHKVDRLYHTTVPSPKYFTVAASTSTVLYNVTWRAVPDTIYQVPLSPLHLERANSRQCRHFLLIHKQLMSPKLEPVDPK